MSTIRANNIQGLDAPNPAIELPIDGTVILASGFSGNLESKGSFTASGLTVDSTATFAVGASGTPAIAASGDVNTGIYFPAADTIGFVEGGNEVARIDSSGRFGIGLTSPSSRLHVQVGGDEAIRASATGANQGIWSRYIAGSPNDVDLSVGADGAAGGSFGVGGAVVWNAGNSPLGFGTNDTERMRITDAGRVGVNTTNFTNGRLIVTDDGSSITPFVVRETAAGTGSVNTVGFFRDTSVVGTISTTGSATAYNTSSDYRLKENVVDLDGAIGRVKQLAPKRFNFIVDAGRTVDGFLAHEAQAVVPEAVTGTHNEVDDDGNPVYQGIDQSKLVPLLTAALQEAIGKIETLEARLTALESA